jgi:peptidoglycan DL-endopeptidase CwlO
VPRWVLVVAGLVAVVAVVRGGGDLVTPAPPPGGPSVSNCAAGAPVAGLAADQMANAATIVAVGREMGVPQRGWTVALATAMQESTLKNLDYGDRDSLGLFQQRPSMGWGTPAQVRDPRYAARKFYDGLLKVPGWQSMPVTVAAQTVQRSGFPGAYAKWETKAAQVVAATTCTDVRS